MVARPLHDNARHTASPAARIALPGDSAGVVVDSAPRSASVAHNGFPIRRGTSRLTPASPRFGFRAQRAPIITPQTSQSPAVSCPHGVSRGRRGFESFGAPGHLGVFTHHTKGHPVTMNTFTQFLSGKRTYLVAIAAIAYLLLCQYTGQKPDETILGIFGALGLAALRAGIPASNAAVNNGTGYPFPPQTPRSQVNGSNSNGVLPCLLVGGLCMVLGTGCLTRPGELTQARVSIKDGKKVITLESHKDTSIQSFVRSPDGTLELKGYESNANQAAIKASTDQAKVLSETLGATMQMFQMLGAMYVQLQSGGMIRPQVPQPAPSALMVVPNAAVDKAPVAPGPAVASNAFFTNAPAATAVPAK